MSLNDVMADVSLVKDEAKLLRDGHDYKGAIVLLQQGIELINRSGWDKGLGAGSQPTDAQRKMAWHLADCYGMLGGNYRRANDLDKAIGAFDLGRACEEDPRLRVSSSYNTVNAIVARIESGRGEVASHIKVLRLATATLERQIFDPEMAADSRRADRWAWADLGLCRLLSGDEEGALAAYRRFAELGDAASIRSSSEVLQRLADTLEKHGDSAAALARKGIDFLHAKT